MNKILKSVVVTSLSISLVSSSAILYAGQFKWPFKNPLDMIGSKTLNDTKIASGLKEALKVGINNTVKVLGKKDGYFRNNAVKLVMPEKFKMLDTALRTVGFGPKLDEFVLSMNRAAEKSAPFARDIFINAIFDMSFDDARAILNGGDTAATDYFKRATSRQLVKAFRPHIEEALDEYGVTRQYRDLVSKYQAIPFANRLPVFSIEDYVINKTMDGLFYVLGNQERKIRTDPAARVTKILKDVFTK